MDIKMIFEKNAERPEFMTFKFSIMVDGDSVFFETTDLFEKKKIKELVNLENKKNGAKFDYLEKENGIRIWCFKKEQDPSLTNKIKSLIVKKNGASKMDVYKEISKRIEYVKLSLDFLIENENLQSRVEQTTGRPKTIYYFETK